MGISLGNGRVLNYISAEPSRYKKVHCQREALDELLTAVFVEAHPEPREKNSVDYVLGMARNERLRGLIGEQMAEAARPYEQTKQPARVFAEFSYRTHKSWSRRRRVVAKAEQLEDKENPRFVVTRLQAKGWPAQRLYEELNWLVCWMQIYQTGIVRAPVYPSKIPSSPFLPGSRQCVREAG